MSVGLDDMMWAALVGCEGLVDGGGGGREGELMSCVYVCGGRMCEERLDFIVW